MVELGRLGYGAADVGNLYRAMSDAEARAVLEAAWESGVRYFDTAPHYGLGLSERRLGSFLATKPREQFRVSTKAGRLLRPSPETAARQDDAHGFAVPASLRRVWDFSAAGIRASLDESLERLGLSRVDILYLHDPDEHDLAADLAMVAGRYTLLEQPALDEVIPACRAAGVGIVAASVFNSGLLATPNPRAGDRYEYGAAPDELLERARRLAEICARHGVALPEAALQFPLREPAVRCVVAGGATAEQVRENARRMRVRLPERLWDEL